MGSQVATTCCCLSRCFTTRSIRTARLCRDGCRTISRQTLTICGRLARDPLCLHVDSSWHRYAILHSNMHTRTYTHMCRAAYAVGYEMHTRTNKYSHTYSLYSRLTSTTCGAHHHAHYSLKLQTPQIAYTHDVVCMLTNCCRFLILLRCPLASLRV